MFFSKANVCVLGVVSMLLWVNLLAIAQAALPLNQPVALQTNPSSPLTALQLPLNSQQLGINGPWQFGVEKSSQFGWIVNNKFLHVLDNNQQALGLELDIGSLENREAITLGTLFGAHQKIKFTAERLEQRIPIYFMRHEETPSIPQYAGGVAYEYITSDHALIRSIEMGGYYSYAQTQNYSPQNDIINHQTFLDLKQVIGGQANGLHLGANVYPWSHAILAATLNYDDIYFPVQSTMSLLNPNTFRSQMGYTVQFNQLFHENHLQFQCSASQRSIYNEYTGSIGWLDQLKGGSIVSMNAIFAHIENFYIPFNDDRIGLQLNWKWEAPKSTSTRLSLFKGMPDDLSVWTNHPAVKMDNVLVEAAESFRAVTDPVAPPVPPHCGSAEATIWADGSFCYSVDFEGSNLSFRYSTKLNNGTFSGLPSWFQVNTVTDGAITRVILTGIAPHVQKQTPYVFLITAVHPISGETRVQLRTLTVVPRLVTLEQVINNQFPAVFTHTEDHVLQGEYTAPPPNTLGTAASVPFALAGTGEPIQGSYTYRVTDSTSLNGMGCHVEYFLDLLGNLRETATPMASEKGDVPRCILTLRKGMNAGATLNILASSALKKRA